MAEGSRVSGPADVVGAVRLRTRRTVAVELERLARRSSLSEIQIEAVAAALERVSTVLVLDRLAAWQGDPWVVAELFGHDAPTTNEEHRRCPN
ncbi:hypothetical protein HMPREF0724_11980 [Prescottella equi ATCC 33707]|uniref:Uncharacterized protein n=1 Tax=Prescottella equi ATCC 33707 TaxID=525370 RepID=F1TJA7_RHOHA|nr:hypothetical protein HMPREF0724_11980 [Prescottella equi ATCC 33707]